MLAMNNWNILIGTDTFSIKRHQVVLQNFKKWATPPGENCKYLRGSFLTWRSTAFTNYFT